MHVGVVPRRRCDGPRLTPLLLHACVCAVAVAGLVAPIVARGDAGADAYQAARSLFTAGKYDEALAAFTQAKSGFPSVAADCQRMIGACYQWKNDFPKAIENYNVLLTTYTNTEAAAEAWYWIGLCHEAQKNIDQAITDFEKQITLFPDSRKTAPAMLKLGERYQDKELYDKAIEQFNRVLSASPENAPRAQLLIGICLQAQKRYDGAIAALTQGIARFPSASGVLSEMRRRLAECEFGVAVAHHIRRDYAKAVEAFTQVADAHPDTPKGIEALLRVDDCLYEQGRYADEIAYLRGLYDRKPGLRAELTVREGMAHLGRWHQTRDDLEADLGVRLLEGVEAAFPTETLAVAASRFRLAMYYAYGGNGSPDDKLRSNPERAREILQEAISGLPDNWYTWWMRVEFAGSYIAQQRYAEGIADGQALLLQAPPDSWKEYLMYLIGDSQIRTGQEAAGVATFERLVAEFPSGTWALTAARRIKALQGQ